MPRAMSARWVTGSSWQPLLVWSSVSACSVPSPQSKGQAEVIWQAGKVSQLSLSFDERGSSLFFFCTLETIPMPLCMLNGPTLSPAVMRHSTFGQILNSGGNAMMNTVLGLLQFEYFYKKSNESDAFISCLS